MMLAAEYVGHVVGGWNYVWTAYGLTWLGLTGFAAYSLLGRKETKP